VTTVEKSIPGVLIGVAIGGLFSGIRVIVRGDIYGAFVVYLAVVLLLSGLYVFYRNVTA